MKFYYTIRLKLKLSKEQALFLFVNGKEAAKSDILFSELYSLKKDSDGFLYIAYTTENVMGNPI